MVCVAWNSLQRFGKTGRTGNQRKIRDYPDYNIVQISWNTKKSPRDLRRQAVCQTQEKDHQQRWCEKPMHYYHYFLPCECFTPSLAGRLLRSVNDSKSPQVSKILLSILAEVKNAEV